MPETRKKTSGDRGRGGRQAAPQLAGLIKGHLLNHISRYHGGVRQRFVDALRRAYPQLHAGTVSRWLADEPAVPDALALYRIATAEGLSLNWLLLELGPERLDATMPHTALQGELYSALADAIARAERFDREAVRELLAPPEQLWSEIVAYYRGRLPEYRRIRRERAHLALTRWLESLDPRGLGELEKGLSDAPKSGEFKEIRKAIARARATLTGRQRRKTGGFTDKDFTPARGRAVDPISSSRR